MQPVLHILTGPTAAGKTAAALDWASQRGASVLSCDAVCVYRGMEIGSAKPSPEERSRVPHYGLDLVSVGEVMTVVDYHREAARVLEEHRRRKSPLIVVGGSGFYLQGFFRAVSDTVPVPPEIIALSESILAKEGIPALLRDLDLRNPGGTGSLDRRNPRRVLKAWQRSMASGRTLDQLQSSLREAPSPYPGWEMRLYHLECPDDVLRRRISIRTEKMLEDGLIEEVDRLCQEGLQGNPVASRAIGYRQVLQWRNSGQPKEALAASIDKATWHLVRKQRQWFRTQLPPSLPWDG